VKPDVKPDVPQAAWQRARALLPGMAMAALIAGAATLVSHLHGGPQLLYALFFGVAFHYASHEARIQPGIEFCSRTVLRLGVGLLGARITLAQIVELGWLTAAVVMVATAATIVLGWVAAPRLGMSKAQGVLSGGSVAICGASAALAIAAVLPRSKDNDRFTLLVVVTVTALSTVAMVLYPLLAKALALSPPLAGLFLGGTIHDVAQVVGAGYVLGPSTGDAATIVKLFRVALLVVVVLVVGALFRGEADQASSRRWRVAGLMPWFLWLFLAMVALNSLGGLPAAAQSGLAQAARLCLVVAIAALGMKTSFAELAQAGWRPFVLIVAETLWLAVLVLLAIRFVL
jgi:uncharacterized integral membrane protein (TIGR00698 family)